MCLDGLRKWKLCQSPLLCQPREDGKARPESILFTSTHRETEHITQPLWHAVTNFIWEHKIYYCTCKSICLISHQRTDPTVEYSLKNGAAVKQLPLAIRTKIHSFNIRLWDSEKNSQKAKLFFKKAIYKQVCLQLRGQNKGRISPILET